MLFSVKRSDKATKWGNINCLHMYLSRKQKKMWENTSFSLVPYFFSHCKYEIEILTTFKKKEQWAQNLPYQFVNFMVIQNPDLGYVLWCCIPIKGLTPSKLWKRGNHLSVSRLVWYESELKPSYSLTELKCWFPVQRLRDAYIVCCTKG